MGLPVFVRNNFAGNALWQLLYGLYAEGLLHPQEVEDVVESLVGDDARAQ